MHPSLLRYCGSDIEAIVSGKPRQRQALDLCIDTYRVTRHLDTVTHPSILHLCRVPGDERRPAAAIPTHAVLPHVGPCADMLAPACLRLQLCIGPGDETVVSGGYDQAVRVWDLRSRSFDPIQTLKPFGDSVTAVLVTKRCGGPSSGL